MPKPQQTEIAGIERPKIVEIDRAARKYSAAREERMALTIKEVAAKAALIEAMQQHSGEVSRDSEDNLVYRFDDQLVIVSDKLSVKVRTDTGDGGEDQDDE